jgi:hypothetical protein
MQECSGVYGFRKRSDTMMPMEVTFKNGYRPFVVWRMRKLYFGLETMICPALTLRLSTRNHSTPGKMYSIWSPRESYRKQMNQSSCKFSKAS